MLKKFGEDLKNYREKKGKTLFDIAHETRIHISNLEKMENGDFNFLPQPYVRAFLKQYIKSLRLNEAEMLYNFDLPKSGKYQSLQVEDKSEITQSSEIAIDKSLTKETIEKEHVVEKEPAIKKHETEELQNFGNIFEEKKYKNPTEGKKYDESKEPIKYSSSKKVEMDSSSPVNDYSGNIALPGKGQPRISPSFFKTIGIVLVVLLLVVAVYLLVTQVFLTDSGKSKLEIVRQNFDDVVKESEKKILGKRSDEEIADSLNKARLFADSIKRNQNDSITLNVVGLDKGVIYVTTDTLLDKNIDKETYGKEYKGTWKAKKCFYITSVNTDSFEAYLNGKKLEFNDKKIKLLKITREGISKEVIKIKKPKPVVKDSSEVN